MTSILHPMLLVYGLILPLAIGHLSVYSYLLNTESILALASCIVVKNKNARAPLFSGSEASLNEFVLLKITELLNDVERLKQALNGLSQLTYTSGVPAKRQNQQVEVLQNQVKTLQQQLAVSNYARCLKCSSIAYGGSV